MHLETKGESKVDARRISPGEGWRESIQGRKVCIVEPNELDLSYSKWIRDEFNESLTECDLNGISLSLFLICMVIWFVRQDH